MKLKYNFELLEIGDEVSAVPMADDYCEVRMILQLNDTGGKIIKYISESETPEEVLEKLVKDYPDDDRDDISRKLNRFMDRLVEENLLER